MADWNWLIAVVLAAVASFVSNAGVTLQKLHHQRQSDSASAGASSESHPKPFMDGFLWLFGLLLVMLGSFADFAALSFGPQSLVAPLGSLTLVSNAVLAPLILKEPIDRADLSATGLIIIGSALAVSFGAHDDQHFTTHQLFSFFQQSDFLTYAIVLGFFMAILYWMMRRIEEIEANDGVESIQYQQWRPLHRFLYPSLSGCVGAQSVLFAKCTVELISSSLNGNPVIATDGAWNATSTLPPGSDSDPSGIASAPASTSSENMFVHPETYLVIGAMFGSIYFQIKFLNDGLKRFDLTYSIPVFQSFWILVSVISGLIFYQEYRGLNGFQISMFTLGVLITIGGVIMLSRKSSGPNSAANSALADRDRANEFHMRELVLDGAEGPSSSMTMSSEKSKSSSKSSKSGHFRAPYHHIHEDSHVDAIDFELDEIERKMALEDEEYVAQPAPAPVFNAANGSRAMQDEEMEEGFNDRNPLLFSHRLSTSSLPESFEQVAERFSSTIDEDDAVKAVNSIRPSTGLFATIAAAIQPPHSHSHSLPHPSPGLKGQHQHHHGVPR